MCLPRIVEYYETVWFTTLCIETFVSPSIILVSNFPISVRLYKTVCRWLNMPPANFRDKLDYRVEIAQHTIANVLVAAAIAIGLSGWSPLLLLLSPFLAPSYLIALKLASSLEKLSAEQATVDRTEQELEPSTPRCSAKAEVSIKFDDDPPDLQVNALVQNMEKQKSEGDPDPIECKVICTGLDKWVVYENCLLSDV